MQHNCIDAQNESDKLCLSQSHFAVDDKSARQLEKLKMITANTIASSIVDQYDRPEQVQAIAENGCGEWEIETAATLTDGTNIASGDVCTEVERICKSLVESSVALSGQS